MSDRAKMLRDNGLRPVAEVFFDGDPENAGAEQPCPLDIWISEIRDSETARQAWVRAMNEPRLSGLSIFMATEMAGLFDHAWDVLCQRLESIGRIMSLPRESPHEPDWVAGLVERRFRDPTMLGLLRRYGIRTPPQSVAADEYDEDFLPLLHALQPPQAHPSTHDRPVVAARRVFRSGERPDELVWPRYYGEDSVRVIACEGHPASGPFRVGWRWAERMAARMAGLCESWHARVGFRPVLVGMATLDAYVEAPPRDLVAIRTLVREQFAFCSDLGQEDAPVVSALLNVLGHQWHFWWD